ncbi:MAG: DNA topoisomerase IV subunit [Erysipelotrichaceae bacterium]|nr:MAG: DNA topoisomerase IV subunit [Erysipelotrichaceae bacterium]
MDKENEHSQHSLESIMEDRFARYSKYIIQERALPDVRDGLKPVQRRILYAMYEDGNTFDKGYRKSAKTVGLVIGNFHPHGDSSVYEAMVRMSQPWKMNLLLVDMQGNNGSIDDDPAAAMRYTEARLSQFSGHLLEDLSKFTVNFAPNFDDTSIEPVVLPARIPQLLINGAMGIAAGYATNIPPHNITEIIDATIARMGNPNCTLADLMQIVKGPDFPTGGIVQGISGIQDAFETGKGRIVIRSKVTSTVNKHNHVLTITEIPYEVIKSGLVKKMDDIRLNRSIEGIVDIRDESDRNGLKIVVEIKKENDPQLILNYLYKNTDLQVYFNYNMVSIIQQRPVQCGLIQILDDFIAFRKEVVLKRSVALYDELKAKAHVLEGLIKAISVLDEIIALIRSSKDKGDAKVKLIERFIFTEAQAEAIVSLRLYRLTNTDILEIKEELAQLQNTMNFLSGVISSPEILKSVVIKEMKTIRDQFPITRRTKIENDVQEIVIDKLSMIPNERVMITISKDGYVKRVSLRSYQASEAVDPAIKEGDQLIGVLETETYDQLLLITDQGSYALIPVYTLDDSKWKDLGSHFSHYVKSDDHEKVIAAFTIKTFDTQAYILTLSQNGFVKKSLIKDFEVTRLNKTYDAMLLTKGDKLVSAIALYYGEEVLLCSKNGFMVRYDFDDISVMQTKAKGVKAMNLTEDRMAFGLALRNGGNAVLLKTENSLMKRIKLSELKSFNRPAKGELIAKRVKSNPQFIDDGMILGSYDEIKITHQKANWRSSKDVPLMDKDATFSQNVVCPNLYLVKGIEEIQIRDFIIEPKKEEEPQHKDVEFIHFDL